MPSRIAERRRFQPGSPRRGLTPRYYNPADGRFTQQDPAGKTTNLYTYAGDNPIDYSDPTGLNLFDDITSGVSDAAGAVATAADVIPGVGDAVGAVAGAVGLAADATKTIGDATGLGDDSVTGDLGADTIAVATVGTAGVGTANEAPLVTLGADIAGNLNDALDTTGAYE